MWHQKALDLTLPPGPPRLIFLRNSDGIEKSEEEEVDDTDPYDKENRLDSKDMNLNIRMELGVGSGDE